MYCTFAFLAILGVLRDLKLNVIWTPAVISVQAQQDAIKVSSQSVTLRLAVARHSSCVEVRDNGAPKLSMCASIGYLRSEWNPDVTSDTVSSRRSVH